MHKGSQSANAVTVAPEGLVAPGVLVGQTGQQRHRTGLLAGGGLLLCGLGKVLSHRDRFRAKEALDAPPNCIKMACSIGTADLGTSLGSLFV